MEFKVITILESDLVLLKVLESSTKIIKLLQSYLMLQKGLKSFLVTLRSTKAAQQTPYMCYGESTWAKQLISNIGISKYMKTLILMRKNYLSRAVQ